jgi:hypothetical protein
MFTFLLNNGLLGPHITKCIDFFIDHVASANIDIQEWVLDASDQEEVSFELPRVEMTLDVAYLEIEQSSAQSTEPIVTVQSDDGAAAQKWTCLAKTKKGFLFAPSDDTGPVAEKLRINRLKAAQGDMVRLTRLFKRES